MRYSLSGHDLVPTRCLVLGLFISALLFGSLPTTAHAIPVAGDYTFTSGLVGTFTSDGNMLTQWSFFDPLGHTWTQDTSTPIINNSSAFSVQQGGGEFVGFRWTDNAGQAFDAPHGDFPSPFTIAYKGAVTQPVPEPASSSLLTLGLLALLGYGWRQRRQAGLQVG